VVFSPQANQFLATINKDQSSSIETTTQNNTQEETITEEEKVETLPKKEVIVHDKAFRCDKLGENHDIKNQINDNNPKLVCQFEFTAPKSPQQSGKVERRFATLYGRVRAMLNEAEFNWPGNAMWTYVSLHATKLDNLLIRPGTHLTPVYMYFGHSHTTMG
jgi:hypothetical protein